MDLLEALLARPDKTLNLLAGGKAHTEKLTDLVVGAGSAKRTIALWSVAGICTSPMPTWSGASNQFHPALSCISPDKKQPVPEWTPKRAASLVTKERLVSKLSGDAACFVHFAIGALMDYLWRAGAYP